MVIKRFNNWLQLSWSKCSKHWDKQSLHQNLWMCTSAILHLLYCEDQKTTASTLISFRDNAHCSLIESKNNNNKRMRHVIKILVFQTTIFIVSYLGNNKRECELLKGLSQRKEQNPFIQTNEFSCKSMERFSCLMLTTTLKGNLFHRVMFLQIGLNQYLTINQFLLTYFFFINFHNCQVH